MARELSRRAQGVGAGGFALVLVVLLGLALVAVEAYAAASTPLERGSSSISAGETMCGGSCVELPFVVGEPFSFGQSFRNDGLFPVTIQAFPDIPRNLGLVRIDTVDMGRDPNVISASPPDTMPFRPVGLEPGDEILIVFRGAFATCAVAPRWDLGTAAVLESVIVRTRLLLLDHEQRVKLRERVSFRAPDEAAC